MSEIKVVHPDGLEVEIQSGAMTRLAGVSEALTGSTGIHLAVATIPPHCASSPHYHVNCESAIYVIKGQGRFVIGDGIATVDQEKTIPAVRDLHNNLANSHMAMIINTFIPKLAIILR